MKIEIGENNSLLVFLTKNEVHTLHLHEHISFEDEASRKILQSVYRDAALHVGFVPQTYEKRVTELLPFSDGSMLLCFSFPRGRRRLKVTARRKRDCKIYEVVSQADLSAFLDNAARLDCVPQEVYESDGCYRFVLTGECAALEHLLKEYAAPVTEALALPGTREYWRAVFSSDETVQ